MVYNNPNAPYAVMMQGTACTTDDQDPRHIKVGSLNLTLVDVAKEYIFFPQSFSLFPQKAHFPQTPSLFAHMTFQSLGYVMKRAAAFRVRPPSVLG